MKNKIKDTWNQYRREQKADKELVIAGYLDFFYDFLKAGFLMYASVFMFVGFALWNNLNHNTIDEVGKIFGTVAGQYAILSFVVIYVGLITSCLAITGSRKMKAYFIAGILFFVVNSRMLDAGIIVFTLKSVINIFLCFVLIRCVLKTVIKVSNIPSRHIPVCYRADTYRRKTGYWWY